MSTIQNHPRFKSDIENFRSKIEKISNDDDKAAAEGLLKELILHVKKMDSMHTEMAYSHTLNNVGSELREGIRLARIKLDKKLKECSV